ncbi:MAG: hypothetical protein G8345_06200 [Magnetococcales bacterium]|nr:hypothetical protein [Magnetococcales bacterium]
MIFLLSGEGPTDLGTTENGCFVPGPLCLLLDQLCGNKTVEKVYISKNELAEIELRKGEGNIRARGIKNVGRNRYFHRNAYALGKKAVQESKVHGSVVAILFRDSDGTHSSPSRQYQDKLDSIKNGFHDAQCEYGVAMLAKPTSEAWLLCALKNQYQGCARLEELPGNRESDRHPKKCWLRCSRIAQVQKNFANWFSRESWMATG